MKTFSKGLLKFNGHTRLKTFRPTQSLRSNGSVRIPAFMAFFILAMASGFTAAAQNPVQHQNWSRLEESPQMIDASYCVMECTSGNPEIFLHLFNENPGAKSLDYTLEVTDVSGAVFKHSIKNYVLGAAAMVQPDCSTSAYPDLRLPVPSGFDPKTITVEISYP